jgi:Sulfatase-modifying factor enzyme 1
MKKFYALILITTFTLGFGSIEPRPTSKHPGSLSARTSVPYNSKEDGFTLLRYEGFEESRLVRSKYSFRNFIVSEKNLQKRVFDSLGSGKFKVIQPPSSVHLTRNIFIDEAEITNIDYREYLFYVKRDSSENSFNSAVPKLRIYNSKEVDYFLDPQNRFFPVIGLTYDQAKGYCKWRSRFVTLVYKREYKKNVNFRFRLPTEDEWELAASNGLNKAKYEYGVEKILAISYRINPKSSEFLLGKILTTKTKEEIIKDIIQAGYIDDLAFNVKRRLPYFLQFDSPHYVYSFYRNDYGIYNMIGNVAEMIEEKGIAKGGSFREELINSKITSRKIFQSPADDIGFRCICEVD